MALPNGILTEQSELTATLIKNIEINPPAELLAYKKFKSVYLGLEKVNLSQKILMDRSLFEYHKSNQVDYANGLMSALDDIDGVENVKFGVEHNIIIESIQSKYDGALAIFNETSISDSSYTQIKIDGGKIVVEANNNWMINYDGTLSTDIPLNVKLLTIDGVVYVHLTDEDVLDGTGKVTIPAGLLEVI